MRFEATISELEREQLDSLADELKMTPSRLITEALALLKTAVIETKKGHRIAIVDERQKTVCAFTSPALSQLEWTAQRTSVKVSPEELNRMVELVESPPEPTPALRKVLTKRK
jgi:hypothetical protein